MPQVARRSRSSAARSSSRRRRSRVRNAVGNSSLRRLSRRYRPPRSAAGLRPLRFHDLRHSFGTMAVRAVPDHRRADLDGSRRHRDDAEVHPLRAAARGGGAARRARRRAARAGDAIARGWLTSSPAGPCEENKDVRAALSGAGWSVVRQKGSHEVWAQADFDQRIVIAGKDSDTVPVGTLGKKKKTPASRILR